VSGVAETPTRVLVLAHKTAATPSLLAAVAARAAEGPCAFTLVVPAATHGLERLSGADTGGRAEAEEVIALALPLLEEAAGGPVEGVVGDPDPVSAIHDAINLRGADEVIISTMAHRFSRWLRLDLPSKVGSLGLPVTMVTARDREPAPGS